MIFNLEFEKSIIGCLLLGKTEYLHLLDESDFSQESLRMVLQAMKELDRNNCPIDVISVSDKLPNVTNILIFLTECTNIIPTLENTEYYFESVKNYSAKRKMQKAAYSILEKVETHIDIATLKAEALKSVDIPIKSGKGKKHDFKTILSDTLTKIDEDARKQNDNRLMTGFWDLDRLTAGLHNEELTIIAARPGKGKTAFTINIIKNLAAKGVKCALVSREMSSEQITTRFIASSVPIDSNKLRIPKSLSESDNLKIANSFDKMCSWPIEINDEVGTLQEIRAYARELKSKDKLDALFIDYLQLCRSANKTEGRRQEVEELSRGFKELSMELQIPVIVLSQLSRSPAAENKPPELHHLRESGSIEQDADIVIFLHTPPNEDENSNVLKTQVIVAKQRNGATGYINLLWYKNTFNYKNIER